MNENGAAWTLLPTLVVRSAGFPWQLVEGLGHARTGAVADDLLELEERAEALRGSLPAGLRFTRGQAARLRNFRALPAEVPVPAGWGASWAAVTVEIAQRRRELEAAFLDGERAVAVAVEELVADPRFVEAVACSSPGVYRDLVRGNPLSARLRRQVGAYAQRFSTKCETMSFFGPINYATVRPDLDVPAVLSWKGHQVCADRRAYLSAWMFDRLHSRVLTAPRLLASVVPRRTTFERVPARGEGVAAVVGQVDGRRDLADLAAAAGLGLPAAADALRVAVRLGFLTHDAIPAATELDPTRWLAGVVGVDQTVAAALALLDTYPAADAAAKVELQATLLRLLDTAPSGRDAAAPGRDAAAPGRAKFYNDRVAVTEAAAGTLEATIGAGLAGDLARRVPAALNLLAAAAVRTRWRTNRLIATTLGPGRFPFSRVLRSCADLAVAHDPWLSELLAAAVGTAAPDAAEIDLAGLFPEPPPPELPVLCSVDVMVAVEDLADYRAGQTPLVLGDVHDAPLLTPWALQFHPDGAAVLADRDRQILRVLDRHRAISVVARRSTGLPPLRFPGPVLEIGTVNGPAERLPLDRLYVSSDGDRAALRLNGHEGELLLHNGELETAIHTAFALPRVRSAPVPVLAHVPRLRYGNVVLSRRRWRLDPVVLAELPARPVTVDDTLALRRSLRRAGVPTRFFAKAPHERKPIYVDVSSPLLVDGLRRLAAGADRLTATEVLPARDGSWLRDGALEFAAEFRCVYLRPADPAHPADPARPATREGEL